MTRHFILERFEDFLTGGNVETAHTGPIPISAGFIIEQNARILEILEKFMTSFESQLQADIASLIDSNTKIVALNSQQVQQIADLQGQLAAAQTALANGGTVTQSDIAALNDIAGKIAATAATTSDTASSSATAPSTPVAEPQQPIVGAPADSGSTAASGSGTDSASTATTAPTTAPSVPAQQPIIGGTVGSGSGSADTSASASSDGSASAPGVVGQ